MCTCGGGQPKQKWRITYPDGASIITSHEPTRVMAEAAGATIVKVGG
jgi:hypothetical protein